MGMPVVDIGEMGMLVYRRLVPMPVLVGLVAGPSKRMGVLVVRVMDMAVTVLHRLMHMFMLMVFGEVQPHTPRHQRSRDPECRRGRFAENHEGYRCANERRGREIGAGSRCPQAAQRKQGSIQKTEFKAR